ncbi:MAG: gliding motility protein GldN [Bacteroidota bacterium]|jgi:gliding motility associated protien GldN
MKNILNLLALIFILILTNIKISFSQSNILDGVYIKEHSNERKVIPYTYLREADVLWSKRIWRTIDLREKANHVLYFPKEEIPGRKSLMQVILKYVLEDGTLTPYEDQNDGDFAVVMTRAKVDSMFHITKTEYITDPNNPDAEPTPTQIVENIPASKIIQFKVKEDWFFDKQRSILECRIIGICPVIEQEIAGVMGKKSLFWIYYPEARMVFATEEVYNSKNDAERRTFEDIFWKRQFASYIYKETNVYERLINEYAVGMDALLESERIKEEIFNMEHDLWEF